MPFIITDPCIETKDSACVDVSNSHGSRLAFAARFAGILRRGFFEGLRARDERPSTVTMRAWYGAL